MSRSYSKWFRIIALPIWVVISFLSAELIASFGAYAIEAVLKISFDSYNQIVVNTVLAAVVYSMTILIAIGVPLLIKKRRTAVDDIGLARLPVWTDIFITPISVVAYFLLSACLTTIAIKFIPWFDMNQAQDTGFDNLGQQYELVLTFFTLVVIAPFAEEVLFRGYLYGKLKKTAPIWLAIIITSVTFGFIHGQWNLAIDTFALSVMLCLLRELTGSIWASILLHMSKNFIAFFFLFINPLL